LKILHTADLHLRTIGDERWQAFNYLLSLGKKEKVSFLTISGDFFAQPASLQKLKTPISACLSQIPFPVIILPGNHDYSLYPEGSYLGEKTLICHQTGKIFENEKIRIWGILPAGKTAFYELQKLKINY
jgi:DNA repair exonuclease SbcCD nuclease subunit